MSTAGAATPGCLDPESEAWLAQLHAEQPVRDAAIRRLHALLLKEARYEIRRRTAALTHPSGRDLEDLAVQAADDALMAILSKLDDFRGDARFTTWARRFAALEVPGKIRRRLGHTRETPTDSEPWLAERAGFDDPEQLTELRARANSRAPDRRRADRPSARGAARDDDRRGAGQPTRDTPSFDAGSSLQDAA